jgi:hypothetical protein
MMSKAANWNIRAMAEIACKAAIEKKTFDRIEFLAQIATDDQIAPFPLESALGELFLNKCYQKGTRFLALFEDVGDYLAVMVDCVRQSTDKLGVYHSAGKIKDRILEELDVTEADLNDVHLNAIPRSWWSPSSSTERILTDHIADDTGAVVEILEKFPGLDLDQSFLNFIMTITDRETTEVVAMIVRLLPVCRSVSRFLSHLVPHLERKVNAMNITDAESEEDAIHSLIALENLMRRTESSHFLRRVQALRTIVEHRPLTIHGISYQLADTGDQLYRVCHAVDLQELMPAIADMWHIPESTTRALFERGFVACAQVSIYSIPFDWEPPETVWADILPLFTHTRITADLIPCLAEAFPPSDSCLARILHPDYLYFYPLIYDQIEQNAPYGPPSAAEMQLLIDIVFARAPLPIRVRYASRVSNYRLAISMLLAIPDEGARLQLFQHEVLPSAISYKLHFTALKEALANHDDLFHALEPVAGPHLQYHIEDHFKRHRRASQIAIDLFNQSRLRERSMKYLDLAQIALEHIEVKNDDDRLLLKGIDLQRQFRMATLAVRDGQIQRLNLFESSEYRTTIAMWCFAANEFRLATDIVRTYGIDGRDIGVQLIEKCIDKADPELLEYFAGLQIGCGPQLFTEMMHPMLLRITFAYSRLPLLLESIAILKDDEFRCRLLIEFGLLDDALAVALEYGILRLVPLIGNLAHSQSKPHLVTRCMKILEGLIA